MKTKVIFRKINNKQSKRFEITQTHWFYFLPTFMINVIKHGPNLIRFQYLFWEIDYAWNLGTPYDNTK